MAFSPRSRGIGRKTARLAAIPGRLPDLRQPPTGCRFAPRCPFATDDSQAPQSLRDIGGRLARCSSAEALRDTPWPVQVEADPAGSPSPATQAVAAEPVVAVEHLSKSFVPAAASCVSRAGARFATPSASGRSTTSR